MLQSASKIKIPPLKIQGIKSKLVPFIKANMLWDGCGRWTEPFLGSGVVLFNVAPQRALVADNNPHIINFYNKVKSGEINAEIAGDYLRQEGQILLNEGEKHFYHIRQRFNKNGSPLDFLFLNRACFNGLIRFNQSGGFNTPFCRKPTRFSTAYVTKIVNQIKYISGMLDGRDWKFVCQPWQKTFSNIKKADFVYADPPYTGRFNGYYNEWTKEEGTVFEERLKSLPCRFLYSMWYENKYRKNNKLEENFSKYRIVTRSHFYHLGASENLRNTIKEALVIG